MALRKDPFRDPLLDSRKQSIGRALMHKLPIESGARNLVAHIESKQTKVAPGDPRPGATLSSIRAIAAFSLRLYDDLIHHVSDSLDCPGDPFCSSLEVVIWESPAQSDSA